MSNKGAVCIIDQGWKVLSTYNSSSVNGVQKFRAVKISSTADCIDLNVAATTMSLGVVQEDVDAVKVATGKVVANVRLVGITKMVVQTATSLVQGSRVSVGNAGGAIIAATTNQQVGICLTAGTIAAGDLIDVLLTPGGIAP